MTDNTSLIAYFSHRGQNYVNGKIVELAVGNTEVVAHKIQQLTGGNLLYLQTVDPYPKDYQKITEVAKQEWQTNARPKLLEKPDTLEPYQTIYLGYPNWWSTMPMAVWTFLESYDFSGKTIVPYCTHEGSGLGRSEQDLKQLCPQAKILTGLAIKGSTVNTADQAIANWLTQLQLIK